MAHAQFVDIPPLEDIYTFFTAATGCPFMMEAEWTRWLPIDPDDVLCFVSYVRPCHQRIMLETANGDRDPCAFLRQLLRPYGYCIVLYRKRWLLKELKEESKTVVKKEGATVNWAG